MAGRLNLTRDQLAGFLKSHEEIKQFEKMVLLVQDYLNSGLVDGIGSESGIANAAAISAGAQALAVANEMGLAQASAFDPSALHSRLDALEAAPTPMYAPPVRRYGAFCDTTTQTAAAINTAYGMTFNTTSLASGVWIGSPASRVYVDRAGIYDFQFSAQLNKASASYKQVFIWARINGADVANSATEVALDGSNAAVVAAWNFVLELNAGDYFELMWSTNDMGCQIVSVASVAPVPAIPSVILTVTDNIKGG